MNLTFGSAQFNPLTSALIIDDIAITSNEEISGEAELLSIKSIFMDFDLTAALQRKLVARTITIDTPRITVKHSLDESYNLQKLVNIEGEGLESIFPLTAFPYPYSLNNITIRNGSLSFSDTRTQKEHHVEDVQLSLPTVANFPYDVGSYIKPGFSAFIDGSPVTLKNGVSAPSTLEGGTAPPRLALSLKSVDLPLYAGYLPFAMPMEITQGTADMELNVSFLPQRKTGLQLNLDYTVQIANGRFISADNSLDLQTPMMRLEGSMAPFKKELDVKNLLLKDSTITVKQSFTQAAVQNLFSPGDKNSDGGRGPQQQPSLTLSLLIADNNKVIVETTDGNRVFHPVQLSIKDFTSKKAGQREQVDLAGSFRLSGESENNSSTFIWQGTFENMKPVGELAIGNIALADILELLGNGNSAEVEGTAEVTGKLSLLPAKEEPLTLAFEQGTVKVSAVKISDGKHALLKCSTATFSPVRLRNSKLHLGNIFLENSHLEFSRKTPPTLKSFVGSKIDSFAGLDFKGDITIHQTQKDKNTLQLNTVHLQINDLTKHTKDRENFIFTGSVKENGTVTAKGSIEVAPLHGNVDIALAKIPASLLLAPSDAFNYSTDAGTRINATGRYSFDQKTFTGAAEIRQGRFINLESKREYSFTKAVLGEVTTDLAQHHFQGAKIAVGDLEITDPDSFYLKSNGAVVSALSVNENKVEIGDISLARSILNMHPDFSFSFIPLLRNSEKAISIANLEIAGQVFLYDDNRQPQNYFDDFRLELSTPSGSNAPGNHVLFTAQAHQQGNLTANGRINFSPFQLDLNFTLKDVSSEILQHFPSKLAKLHLTATLNGEVKYTFPENLYSGKISLFDGSLTAGDDKPSVRWREAGLHNFEISESPFYLKADKLFLDRPQIPFSRDTNHFLAEVQAEIKDYFHKSGITDSKADYSLIDIDRVEFQEGTIDYVNENLSPPWRSQFSELAGSVDNFYVAETADNIDYSIKGLIAPGRFEIDGTYNPASGQAILPATFHLDSLPLKLYENQLSPLFRVGLEDSLLSMSLEKEADSDQYSATLLLSSILVKDPDSPEALVLALLSDETDSLTLSFPLQNYEEPLFTQITNSLQKLIVKCSVSPYLLLQFPYDALRDQQNVVFTPGTSELSTQAETALVDFANLLHERPLVELKLTSYVQRSADAKALREILAEEEKKRVKKENERLLEEWQQQLSGSAPVSDDSLAVKDISEEELTAFTPITPTPVVISDAMLLELGAERVEKIRNFILTKSNVTEKNVKRKADVSLIDTLDMPEVHIDLGRIDSD